MNSVSQFLHCFVHYFSFNLCSHYFIISIKKHASINNDQLSFALNLFPPGFIISRANISRETDRNHWLREEGRNCGFTKSGKYLRTGCLNLSSFDYPPKKINSDKTGAKDFIFALFSLTYYTFRSNLLRSFSTSVGTHTGFVFALFLSRSLPLVYPVAHPFSYQSCFLAYWRVLLNSLVRQNCQR